MRVRLQSRGHYYAGSMDVVVATLRAEGLRGFFRGSIPPLLGMGPKNAIGFGAHGLALRFFEGGTMLLYAYPCLCPILKAIN